MSIVLIGILGAITAVFLQAPIRGYLDVSRRAVLSDTGNLALRRIARDLQTALPNSVRVTNAGGSVFLEFLPVRSGGRYRVEFSGAPNPCPEQPFATGVATASLSTLGDPPAFANIAVGDWLVIYNLGSGNPNADAYETGPATGGNKSRITGTVACAGENRINYTALAFLNGSPSNRFHVVSGPVTYACNPVARTLTRHAGYAISVAQPVAFGAGDPLLADNVAACNFTYDQIGAGAAQRSGLVIASLTLSATDAAGLVETVTLHSQFHVANSP